MNSPILLCSGRLTINFNQILEPDSSRMQNPFKTPMLIDEIRFRTDWGDTQVGTDLLSARVEIKLGRTPLTKGFVPVSCLGKVILDQPYVNYSPDNITRRHTWKLPKPLLVMPEDLLVCRLAYSTYKSPESMSIEVAYAGRSLPSSFVPPEVISMPWATSFDVPLLAYTDGNSGQTLSTQSDIMNPFDEPMRVQRFLGRTLRKNNQTDPHSELGGQAGDSAPFTQTFVRATDSLGNILVRDPTPFAHLFQYCDRAWTVNSTLPPKGFYRFQVDRLYTATASNTFFAHAISMVGSHEVRLK